MFQPERVGKFALIAEWDAILPIIQSLQLEEERLLIGRVHPIEKDRLGDVRVHIKEVPL